MSNANLTPETIDTTVIAMPYLFITIVVLIASPFVLLLSQSQKKEDKRNLKNLFLFILVTQVGLGALNWENFSANILGFQAVSFASAGAVFLVLTGNIVSLALINKNKNLLKKYFK